MIVSDRVLACIVVMCVPAKVPLGLNDRNAALVRLSCSRSLRWLHDLFCMKDRNYHDACVHEGVAI